MVNTLLAVTKLTCSPTAQTISLYRIDPQSVAFNAMLLILREIDFGIWRALTVYMYTHIFIPPATVINTHNMDHVDFRPRAITHSKYHSLTHCLLWSNTVEIVTSLFTLAYTRNLMTTWTSHLLLSIPVYCMCEFQFR